MKLYHRYCGGEMKIKKKVARNVGMDGMHLNWELTCSKCGLTKVYADYEMLWNLSNFCLDYDGTKTIGPQEKEE